MLKVTPGDGTLKIKDENRDMLPHDGISAFDLLISPHGLHKTIGTAPDPRRCGMAQSGCSAAIGALFFPADGPPTPDVDDTVFLEAPAFAVRVHVRAVPNPKTRWVTRYLLPRQGSPRFSLHARPIMIMGRARFLLSLDNRSCRLGEHGGRRTGVFFGDQEPRRRRNGCGKEAEKD